MSPYLEDTTFPAPGVAPRAVNVRFQLDELPLGGYWSEKEVAELRGEGGVGGQEWEWGCPEEEERVKKEET